jgi:hypothetical protein
MKRITLLLTIFLFLGATSISVTSCDKDEEKKSCEELTLLATDAAFAFLEDMESTDLCNAYKSAVQDMLDGCDNFTQAEIDEYEADLALYDCENL